MPPILSAEAPRLLVVDDSHAAATIIGRIVEAIGWRHDVARDGFEAISCLKARTYSAVLLDYVLPGMNGADIMAWITRNLSEPPPVYVHSSEQPETLRHHFRDFGVRGFLPKPVSPAALCAVLEAA